MIIAIFAVVVVGVFAIASALAKPSFKKGYTDKQRFQRTSIMFFGIVLPLIAFFVSMFLTPAYKSHAELGWIDSFHLGKIILTPLVFWAAAAFYSLIISDKEDNQEEWVVLGLPTGAFISFVCFVHAVAIALEGSFLWLLGLSIIPLYICVWYTKLSISLARISDAPSYRYMYALLGSLPFWGLSLYLSKEEYNSLATSPQCFVVTAAGRGHSAVVGPFITIERRGESRQVNQQLVLFWRFEELWSQRTPRLHRLFRHGYNVAGPFIARRIQGKWTADVVYLALKPVEMLVQYVMRVTGKDEGHSC